MQWDIIPDIHGQFEKLKGTLSRLGYHEHGKVWRQYNPERNCIFLGDFIDRGPNNADVIDLVRRMIDAGTARAIMGNHELNALHFHSDHPDTGDPLRKHSPKNLRQHQSFLAEFPLGAPETKVVIDWMQSLPLFLEYEDFRIVHACWEQASIESLKAISPTGVLSADDLVKAADETDPLHGIVETTTKGPEVGLPAGYEFTDKDGTRRREIRLKWWNESAANWRDIAMSVPDPKQLPDATLPETLLTSTYPTSAKPVFFGHYWLSGALRLQAPNALCLDYSAGSDGPLVSYQMNANNGPLTLTNISGHGGEPQPEGKKY